MKKLLTHFPDLNDLQQQQLQQLHGLYADWNQKINVISRKDIDALYERHVLHALGIAKVVSFLPHAKILDVGTGGGFPGIPLAILFPETDFYLVDSIQKKIGVVNAVAAAVGLTNVQATHQRAEQWTHSGLHTSRAVAHRHGYGAKNRNGRLCRARSTAACRALLAVF